jgi:hypothetical protein
VSSEPNSLNRDRPAVRGVRSVDVVCVRAVVEGAVGEKRIHSSDASRGRLSCCEDVATSDVGSEACWGICRELWGRTCCRKAITWSVGGVYQCGCRGDHVDTLIMK